MKNSSKEPNTTAGTQDPVNYGTRMEDESTRDYKAPPKRIPQEGNKPPPAYAPNNEGPI